MSIEWIDTTEYGRRDLELQISVYTSGTGRLSKRLVKTLDISRGDYLRFCQAQLNGEDKPRLYMTIQESGPGLEVKDPKNGGLRIRVTRLMYALGYDHTKEPLRIVFDENTVFADETFFYPCEVTERE